MAKVPFSKLQVSVNKDITTLDYTNKSGEVIKYEVKYYLPFAEKLDLITTIINASIDDQGFYNPMKLKLYTVLHIIYAYTNLNFTEKQKEDPFKLYDMLVSNGIFNDVVKAISPNDWDEIEQDITIVINNIYNYKNSIHGILESLSTDYSNLDLDASEIQKKLADPDNLELLKSVLTKLG